MPEHVPRGVRHGRRRGGRLRRAAGHRRTTPAWPRSRARWRAAVPARPRAVAVVRVGPGAVARPRRARSSAGCRRRRSLRDGARARRSSRPRASATPGRAWRGRRDRRGQGRLDDLPSPERGRRTRWPAAAERIGFRAGMSRSSRPAPLLRLRPSALLAAALWRQRLRDHDADLVAGKQLFVTKCGSCHTLARAGTKGTTGRTSTQASSAPLKDGFGESRDPRRRSRSRSCIPNRSRAGGIMPAKLVTRAQDADDVAAYVASVVAQPGKDTGLLATPCRRPRASAGRREERHAADRRRPERPAAYGLQGHGAAGQAHDRHAPTSRASSTTSRSTARATTPRASPNGEGSSSRRPSARHLHRSSARSRPPPGRHGGHAHRQVARPRRRPARSLRAMARAGAYRARRRRRSGRATARRDLARGARLRRARRATTARPACARPPG